jgi:preprotein translocase subunit SecA
MNTLKIEDDLPIESGMLSGQIESAQRKVEARNFGIRKSVLDFDDVMNRQRELIYGQRAKVLDGDDLSENVQKMIEEVIDGAVDLYLADTEVHDEWNLASLRDHFLGWITEDGDFRYSAEELSQEHRDHIRAVLKVRARELYARREEMFTAPIMREMERVILLKNVDIKWMDHIDAMSELKQGIYLRSYGQKDPVVEYRLEGFEMFDEMIASIREDTVKMLYLFQIRREEAPKREQVAKPTEAVHGDDGTTRNRTVRKTASQKVGRNDPCPCGSGKKYKKCCGAEVD